jgi:hypothetical protein
VWVCVCVSWFHSLTHSPTHPPTHSLTHSPTHFVCACVRVCVGGGVRLCVCVCVCCCVCCVWCVRVRGVCARCIAVGWPEAEPMKPRDRSFRRRALCGLAFVAEVHPVCATRYFSRWDSLTLPLYPLSQSHFVKVRMGAAASLSLVCPSPVIGLFSLNINSGCPEFAVFQEFQCYARHFLGTAVRASVQE